MLRTFFSAHTLPAYITPMSTAISTAMLAAIAGLASALPAPAAHAHAVVGERVFPATMTVDDPGVGDEFDVQSGHIKSPDNNRLTSPTIMAAT